MIDFELGSVDFWVAHDKCKPYPITIYRKDGTWKHDAHPPRALSDQEQLEQRIFVKERIQDLQQLWKQHMSTRLKWDAALKKRKGKGS